MPREARKIEAADVLSLEDYIAVRKQRKADLVVMKKPRRIELGPHATAYFENYETMLSQIQEMLYIEKGGDEQLEDEMRAYNPLIPQGRELVCTFMFEIDDPVRRLNMLLKLTGIENHIFIDLGDAGRIYARPEEDVERTTDDGKTSSVHFFHFDFTDEQAAAFKSGNGQAILGCDHENYGHMAVMSEATRTALAADLD